MSDIFISYASGDRSIAHEMAEAFETLGWSVWWDREIPIGKSFDQVIEEELNAARCVVVLWSRESARSRWVKTEAAAAADRDRLIPVLIEEGPIPLEFKRIQTAMLPGWRGERERPEFLMLSDSIRQMLGQPPAPSQAKVSRPSPRGSSVRTKIATGAGAALLVPLLVMLVKPGSDRQEPAASKVATDPRPMTSPPANLPGGEFPSAKEKSTAGGDSASPPPAPGVIAIKIGDKIQDGVPATGAGNIDSPGAKDVYRFTAAAGQGVYFRMHRHERDLYHVGWALMDPDNREIFNSYLGRGDSGVHQLKKAGTYTMTVGSDRNPGTGTYHLQLFNVPPPRQFVVKLGDTTKDGTPGLAAGEIESPGAKAIYTFAAAPGQRVYFRMAHHDKELYHIRWKLNDAEGTEIFDTYLGRGDPGVKLLKKGGAYAMTIGSDADPATGGYRLRVLEVPTAQQFAIKVGDTIKENTPGLGAGHIASPGAKNVYTFSASPGQRVYFRMFEHAKELYHIRWKLIDSDGTEVFDTYLGRGDPGAQVLRKGGTYTMTIGSDLDPGTGAYRLQLSSAAGG